MTIHTECFPDEALIKCFGFSKKNVHHHDNINEVLGYLSKNKGLIAMIDEDPGKTKHSYHKSLILIEEKHHIKIMVDKKLNHKVILLCTELESWFINASDNSNVDIVKIFGLERKSANMLHDVINKKLDKIPVLVTALIEKKSPSILYLKSQFTI